MGSTRYFIGTAGWSYKDWVPSFYPKSQTAQFDWLQFYSHYFNFVEVNSTYYAYINPRIVHGWIEKVSGVEDFRFSIKLHQDFTHNRKYDQQKINAVCFILELLTKAERLGGLLIQFPYSFSCNQNNINYISRLKENFEKFNCFIEVRHQSWMNEKAYEIFKQLNISYVAVDQPQLGNALPFRPILTNSKAYIRFHGRNKEAWQKSIYNFGKKQSYEEQNNRYDYLYLPGELKEFELSIESKLNTAEHIYIIFNNHPKGQAVANAFQFINYLENKLIEIPKTTLTAFPQLKGMTL